MSNNSLAKTNNNAIESVLIGGDLSKLSPEQRVNYYKSVCDSLGLNVLTRPFDYITLNGKLTLYARRDCADQLRNIHKVSINITSREKIDDIYIVTAKAKNSEGREDESTGAVNVAGLKGEALANAFMKAETKSKRRVTLSICGLGLLDETEVETIVSVETPVDVTPKSKDILGEYKEKRAQADADANEHIVTFGKFKGQKLGVLDPYEVAGYVSYIERKAEEDGKEITGKVLEFITYANKWIDSKVDGFSSDVDAYVAAKNCEKNPNLDLER